MMKKETLIFVPIIILLVIISFFFGLKVKSSQSNKLFNVKGNVTVNVGGQVKEITNKHIILKMQNGEINLPLQKNTFVYKPDNTVSSNFKSSPSMHAFSTQLIKKGQAISAKISVSDKGISVSTLYILSK